MKNNKAYILKILWDYKNKMIWLMNTDYSQKRKMVIALDLYERTQNRIDDLFPKQKFKDIKSPLDTP